MLVLSRHPNEKILLPSIQTTIQVVSVKPGVVRLGFDAPAEVTILRAELVAAEAAANASTPRPAESAQREFRHEIRNRLNAAQLGLALMQQQVQAGLGAEAEATLARVRTEFQSIRDCIQEPASPRPAPRRKPRKALVVEDDTNERELLAGFLRMAGLDVATAGDGADALDYLRTQGRPDVILLDMVLPRCDGPTMLRLVRQDPAYAGLKVFALTGHEPEHFGLGRDVDRWFHKPLNPEALLHDLAHDLDG